MSQESARRTEAKSSYTSVSGEKPWKQDDGDLKSRYRYAVELANICREEGDEKAVYHYLIDASDYGTELASRHPDEGWESIEAGLQYAMATNV